MHRLFQILTWLLMLTATTGSIMQGYPLAAGAEPPVPLFVDTDTGVDDALAIAWLLNEPRAQIVGFSTVFGNTSLDDATRNLLTLLGAAGRHAPVAVGADAPLALPRSRTGTFVHGPDGFWFQQAQHDLAGLPRDAPAAIARAARDNPGLTILALGPLTNIALAAERHPADMAGVRLIAIAGAKHGGNATAVAEANAYRDPHALAAVLGSAMEVELVTLDAFDSVRVDAAKLVKQLEKPTSPVGALLASILPPYAQALTGGAPGTVSVPDAAATIYALSPALGTPTSALVDVVAHDSRSRGLTLVADTFGGRITQIADDQELSALADRAFTPGFDRGAELGAILQRRPDNCRVVLSVDGPAMSHMLELALARL